MPVNRVLAVAARSRKLACVLISNGKVKAWHGSRWGIKDSKRTEQVIQQWMKRYGPSVVVTEDLISALRKGPRQKSALVKIKKTAQSCGAKVITLHRKLRQPNTTKRAEALSKCFPSLAHLCPRQPKLWETERESTTLFEALGLADAYNRKSK